MNLESAVNQALAYKHFHRMHPPGVAHNASIDGPYNLVQLIPDNSVMIELGSYWGESTLFFSLSGKFKKIYAVDPFTGQGVDDANGSMMSEFINRVVLPSNDVVELVRDFSQNAIPMFPDNHFDFAYVDAVHDYPNVSAELKLLLPKMKPGSILAGHDYCGMFPGLMQAVDEVMGKPDIIYTDTSWMKRLP